MLCLKRKSSNLQRLFPPFYTASAICNQRWRLKLCSLVILHPHDFHLSLCNFVMMFFSFSHFQAGWNQSIETKLRYSGAQKNIFYIPLLLVLRGGEVMAVVIPVGRYVPQIGLRSATRTYNRGQKLQTENLDPAHHQIKDGKMPLYGFILDWGMRWWEWGFLFHFFLCKIVAECFCHLEYWYCNLCFVFLSQSCPVIIDLETHSG